MLMIGTDFMLTADACLHLLPGWGQGLAIISQPPTSCSLTEVCTLVY